VEKLKKFIECFFCNLFCLVKYHSWDYEVAGDCRTENGSTDDHRIRRVCGWCGESQAWLKDGKKWNTSPWLKGRRVRFKDFIKEC
jgi:hypothetical protein